MGKIYILLFVFIIFLNAGPVDKKLYDLDKPNLAKITNEFNYVNLTNDFLEATLIDGGYFTIGTTAGITASGLDDRCAITFGHPYAKTSYPVFSIDNNWYKLDEYFSGSSELQLSGDGDTINIVYEDKDLFRFKFSILFRDSEGTLGLDLSIINLDTTNHSFAAGLVLDAGIGRWGDGYIFSGDEFFSERIIFDEWPEATPLQFYEKSIGARGISFELNFDTAEPDKIIVANWYDLYNSAGPDLPETSPSKLYDLCNKIIWPETALEPQENLSVSTSLTLKEADFSNDVFMRWDLPSFLSMENNRLFPRDYETSFEVHNLTDTALENLELILDIPTGFSLGDSESRVTIPPGHPAYPQVNLRSNLVYEDYIVGLTARLEVDGEIIDEIFRNVYIPATPVSDSGLVVSVDSLITSDFPEVKFIFKAINESNEYLISNIQKENVFLYENGSRIENYKLMEDTTGGVSAADIVFVLDVTGSMGNEIAEVKDNIIEFADSLQRRGVNYRLGMVTFLDEIENIYAWTNDVQEFQSYVADQYAHGGGDGPENSLDALMAATKFDFRPNAKRVIIWITDNSYHENDWATSLTKTEVMDELLSNEITTHCIGAQAYKSSYYDPILLATGGDYFDIYGNFRDILLTISRFNSSGKLLIAYDSPSTSPGTNYVQLDIRYQGLGGSTEFNYEVSGSKSAEHVSLKCFPNPFNPTITFQIQSHSFTSGNITIFNILGQRVKTFTLLNDSPDRIIWNAKNEFGRSVVSGLYIVQLSLKNKDGKMYNETARILHLK